MLNPSFFEDMAKKLSQILPEDLSQFKQDFERNCRSLLESTFAKLNLVTREEFEVQKAVLAKTRSKIEELEKQLSDLEARLKESSDSIIHS